MTYKRNSVLLTGVAVTLLGGCAHKPVPVPRTTPPPSLMVPPESPATRERLEKLLPPTSPRVNETRPDSPNSRTG